MQDVFDIFGFVVSELFDFFELASFHEAASFVVDAASVVFDFSAALEEFDPFRFFVFFVGVFVEVVEGGGDEFPSGEFDGDDVVEFLGFRDFLGVNDGLVEPVGAVVFVDEFSSVGGFGEAVFDLFEDVLVVVGGDEGEGFSLASAGFHGEGEEPFFEALAVVFGLFTLAAVLDAVPFFEFGAFSAVAVALPGAVGFADGLNDLVYGFCGEVDFVFAEFFGPAPPPGVFGGFGSPVSAGDAHHAVGGDLGDCVGFFEGFLESFFFSFGRGS